MHNPDCDAAITPCGPGEVRVLPYVGGNLNLCRKHYEREMAFRRERNKSVASPYALPSWESLAPLREAEREPLLGYDTVPVLVIWGC